MARRKNRYRPRVLPSPSTAEASTPRLGCQQYSTGAVGAFFLISLSLAYANFLQRVENGGPAIAGHYLLIPPASHIPLIGRTYFDMVFLLVLCFVFMASWELQPRYRPHLLVVGGFFCLLAWIAATSATHETWFLYEFMLATLGLALAAFWLRPLLGMIEDAPWRNHEQFSWALKTATWRWMAGMLAFALVLRLSNWGWLYPGNFQYWRITCALLVACYAILGLPYALVTNLRGSTFADNTKDPGFMLLLIYRALTMHLLGAGPRRAWCIMRNRRTLVVLRDLGVKIFFVPLMLTFFFNSYQDMLNGVGNGKLAAFDRAFQISYHGLFVVDTGLALIGYLCACRWLGNKSVSVEPTFGGWAVALCCYPPFNQYSGDLLPYGRAMPGNVWLDFTRLGMDPSWNQHFDMLLQIITLGLFTIYVAATVSFGLRFSNLTNRGIVGGGPYALIRHPAYATKNIAWWTENVRHFTCARQFFFLFCWNVIYTLRALTEERHLKRDPAYREYCSAVRWRFIPGVW